MPSDAFNEEKATQACTFFLAQAPGGRMGYIKALKLLYFFERETLKQTGFPVLQDELFIMKHGPVLSNTMDLMTEQPMPGEASIWRDHIQTDGYDLVLKKNADLDLLSETDLSILNELWAKFGHLGRWKVVEAADNLPENIVIKKGRLPLSIKDIFPHFGFSSERAAEQEAEIISNRR